MGFYGNITNQSKTQFQFDRTYPNRYEMDKNTTFDGVYAGRYVLVEYDTDTKNTDPGSGTGYDVYKTIYYASAVINGEKRWHYYNSSDASLVVTASDIAEGDLVNCRTVYESGNIGTSTRLLLCEGFEYSSDFSKEIAVFKTVTTEEDNYTRNYQTDVQQYGPGRGWDSTVWQKTYTNGKEKYIMIAELNSVVPTFVLTADAPTEAPIMPHFDKDSTNVYYRMHYQPQYGLRTKTANNYSAIYSLTEEGKNDLESGGYDFSTDNFVYPSDEKTQLTRYEYDKATNIETLLYYNEKNGNWLAGGGDELDAAIYYNRAGFDPKTITYGSDTTWGDRLDKISITNTGQSGHQYNKHDGDQGKEVRPDIKELSIMLPSIGDSIAKMWNVVYGDEEINGNRTRNLDIDWDSNAGLRAVNLEANGYSFTQDNLTTLAGSINSVHDLMGMIISQEKDELTQQEINDATTSNIYYYKTDGTFRRKHETFDYEEIEYTYSKITVPEANYKPDTFYLLVDGNYVKDTGPYSASATYYEKLTPGITYTDVNLVDYEPGKYYYKEISGNFRFEEREVFQKDRKYYDIVWNTTPENLYKEYTKNTYYYKDGNNYILDTNNEYTKGRKYFLINKSLESYNVYAPNTYYYYPNDVEDMSITPPDKALGDFADEVQYYDYKNELYTPIALVKYEANKYYTFDANNNYILLAQKPTSSTDVNDAGGVEKKFYTIEITSIDLPFYEANKYYYQKDKDYILSGETVKNDNINYYTYDKEKNFKELDSFYAPNTYYIIDEGEYVKDKSESIDSSKTYYIKNNYYIISDEKEIFSAGSVWNGNVLRVPATIKLGTRTSRYEMQVLEGFARTLNTIHGLILRINYLLEAGDQHTRDIETAQGAINQIKDIIEKIDELTPGQLMIVNDLGQIAGADYTTSQAYTSKDLRDNKANKSIATTEDRWIYLDVNDENKVVTLEHRFTAGNNTTNTIDMNSSDKGDTFTIVTPIVDTMGHTVAKNTETITLPYGFKTITTNGAGTAVTNAASNTTSIVADNSKDTLAINSANKWIRIANNATSDTMAIGHEVHTIDTASATATDLNNPVVNSITIQDIQQDEAGHITSNKPHTYTLPYGYKQVSVTPYGGSSAAVIANNTQDNLNLNATNEWVVLSGTDSTNTVAVAHKENNVQETTANINLNSQNTFEALNYTFDTAGHITSSSKKTYTLPYALKTVNVTNQATSVGTITPDSQTSILTLNTGNEWLNLSVSGKTATIAHKTSLSSAASKGAGAATYNFGSKFTVPVISADTAGHITSLTDYEVTLPSMSLTSSTSGNVLTGLTLNSTTGALALTKSNIGNLALTGYQGTNTVLETNTVNEAIKIVEDDINLLKNNFGILTGTIDPVTEFSISYPEGFTSDNCVLLSIMINNEINTNNIAVTLESQIHIYIQGGNALDKIDYKFVLMKI